MNEVQSGSFREKIDQLTKELSVMPQVECPVRHYFAPGIYIREAFMPAGSLIVGKRHKTEHFNELVKGRIKLIQEGLAPWGLTAPWLFTSEAGAQKIFVVYEDTIFRTIHATSETNLETLEALLIEPPAQELIK